jgi:hypothetical protein
MAEEQAKMTEEETKAVTLKGKVDDVTVKLLKLYQHLMKQAGAKAKATQTQTLALIKDPHFQTVCISTSAGAVVLGSIGGAFGCASGIVLGGTAGVVPALLTFGLSIPAGAALGGGMGLCTGAVVGGSAGAVGAGVAGHAGYKHRVQIKDGCVYIHTTAVDTAKEAQIKITGVVNGTLVRVRTLTSRSQDEAMKLVTFTKDKLCQVTKKPIAFAREPKVQMTTVEAAAGTVAGGVMGGSAGVLAGAAVGLVPALFTFGLSIPVGAAIGGSVGLFTGGSVGAVGGGAAGFAGYTYRKELKESKEKTCDYVNKQVKGLKDRLSSGTGGTA